MTNTQRQAEGTAPAQSIEDFNQLKARQLTRSKWIVGNLKNGDKPTAYHVDLEKGVCTCGDNKFNIENGSGEVCKHFAYALFQAPRTLEADDMAVWTLATLVADGSKAVQRLQDAAEGVQAAEGGTSTAAPAAAPDAAETDALPEEEAQQAEAEAAAETLQSAFDEHLSDMRVQAHAGHVWFKTGYDTEEEWPYPGVDETFQAVTAPECVEYVSEGGDGFPAHDLYDEKPGEYWKNALAPGDVEQYIEEVLE